MNETDLFVDSDNKLEELLETVGEEKLLALDTEFIREKTYYPQLCLIQIASSRLTACIDCLADFDRTPFFDLLFREECIWVLHSARQDLEVIYLQDERTPSKLIDTQTAAGLLGYAPQIGLQGLLVEELSVELEKGHTRTDWTRRPLPPAAVDYALDDVRYLLALWKNLEDKLAGLGRLDWLESDCADALTTPPVTPPTLLWSRLRGLQTLDADQQRAALALVEWRERNAQLRDRPRRWIMADDILLRIARQLPGSASELELITEIPDRLVERAGSEILSELSRCLEPPLTLLPDAGLKSERPDKAELSSLQELVRNRADELGIQSEVLATRKEIGDLLIGRTSERIGSGWRRPELDSLLRGNA